VRFGAHVRRGTEATHGVVRGCRDRGADCAQVFLSNPRAWAPPRIGEDDAAAFREAWAASGLTPLAAHAPYLVNIAAPDDMMLTRSRELALATVRTGDEIGVDLVVFHSGAGGASDPEAARERAATTLRALAESTSASVLVELMAGTAGAVASTVAEGAALLEAAGVDGIGLCLDICHLFAAGYALDRPEGVSRLFDELSALGMTERVRLVHANDSMFPMGLHRDRHAPIGEGMIGEKGWRALLARPEAAGLPFVLETPGDAAGHARDIARLRSWARA
jgi:deoxyribonuclease-4